jgi:hypothetical protein
MGHLLVVVTVSVGIVAVSRVARRDALSILLVLFVPVGPAGYVCALHCGGDREFPN